jgi:mannose-1-phosphate guanylyltransferase
MKCNHCSDTGIEMGTDLALFCCVICDEGKRIGSQLTDELRMGMNDLLSEELIFKMTGKKLERFKGSEGIKRILSILQDNSVFIQKPWGKSFVLEKAENYRVKKLVVDPNKSLSLQFHNHRTENWSVVAGAGEVILNGEIKKLEVGTPMFIPVKVLHQLKAGENGITVIETWTKVGSTEESILSESDIVRMPDDYYRSRRFDLKGC